MKITFLRPLLIIFTFFFPRVSSAYYSSLDTGELLKEDEYKASFETQFITDDGTGTNFVGRFDTWMSDELNAQALLGFGEVDIQLGGFVKWVPIPDYGQQPALGVKLGGLYARQHDAHELNFRVSPFLSKSFETNIGIFQPFASLPTGVRTIDGDVDTPLQVAFGTEWKTFNFEKLRFLIEAGFDINEAFTYISFSASLFMDDENGIVFE